MPVTTYHSGGVAPRSSTYAYGIGGRSPKKSQRGNGLMPYKTKPQAKAVLANTDPKNPKHREARMHAKTTLRKPRKPKMNGLMIKRM